MTLFLIIFGFIYLSGDASKTSLTEDGVSNSAQFVLVSAENDESVSNDFSGSSTPLDNSHEFLVETNYIGQFSYTYKRIDKSNSQFANQNPQIKIRYSAKSRNTLSLVDSGLGHQFTLLGEKPSGTS